MADAIHVRMGELRVGGPGDTLVTVGLGSCVAIVLYHAGARMGGLAHVLLPSPSLSREVRPGKFPQTAIPEILSALARAGAGAPQVTARLVGGASMFANLVPAGTIQMGERNVVAARAELARHRIPIIGEDVGGSAARTVRFRLDDGRVEVSTTWQGSTTL